MAIAIVTGTFISANLRKSEYDGKTTYSTMLDIYQKDSPLTDKMVSIKVEDAELLSKFNSDFAMGDEIQVNVTVSSYKNNSYFKYISLVS